MSEIYVDMRQVWEPDGRMALSAPVQNLRVPEGLNRCLERSVSAMPRKAKHTGKSGWPKQLPCLVCDKLRTAMWAGDRLHHKCRNGEPERPPRSEWKV